MAREVFEHKGIGAKDLDPKPETLKPINPKPLNPEPGTLNLELPDHLKPEASGKGLFVLIFRLTPNIGA